MADMSRRDLAQHRINVAEEKYKAAIVLLREELFKDSIGRSYYCIFSAARAILALDGVDYSKHAGVISYFQKNYVKRGVFSVEYSDIIGKAFQVRNLSDYDDMYIASQKDAESQLKKARFFLDGVIAYLNSLNTFN